MIFPYLVTSRTAQVFYDQIAAQRVTDAKQRSARKFLMYIVHDGGQVVGVFGAVRTGCLKITIFPNLVNAPKIHVFEPNVDFKLDFVRRVLNTRLYNNIRRNQAYYVTLNSHPLVPRKFITTQRHPFCHASKIGYAT